MSIQSQHINIDATLRMFEDARKTLALSKELPLCIQKERILEHCKRHGMMPVAKKTSRHMITAEAAAAIVGVTEREMFTQLMDAYKAGLILLYVGDNSQEYVLQVEAGDLRDLCGLCGC